VPDSREIVPTKDNSPQAVFKLCRFIFTSQHWLKKPIGFNYILTKCRGLQGTGGMVRMRQALKNPYLLYQNNEKKSIKKLRIRRVKDQDRGDSKRRRVPTAYPTLQNLRALRRAYRV